MQLVLWLVVALPLAGAVAARLGPPVVAVVAAVAAAVPAWVLLAAAAGGERARSALGWLPAAQLDVGLRLDGLSAAMAVTVATVGLVVVVYATGYHAGDPRRRSALAGLLAFLAAMQALVLAEGFLTLLIAWEVVGALSARLIAFNRDDAGAPRAAVRAFLTTRAADVGLYVAVLALWAATGSLDFGGERPAGALGALVGAGLVVAAIGKSAQAPLQGWLAAAMAGPTPVSALLHSATMVAAGVVLLVRAESLLEGWPLALAGWVGAVTAVAAGAIALAQDDLKRVLAASTTSQLGLMFVGAAVGGPAVALFHLVVHAAGKAGMFLCAGILQHRHGSTALSDLRGAGRDDRATLATLAVCAASIAAVPPLAGFWSKDAIVAAAEPEVALLALVLVASAGSAAYLLRPVLVLWRPRDGQAATAAATGRPPMLAAAGALAGASVVLGLAGHPLGGLLGAEVPAPAPASVALSVLALAAGAGAVLARPRVPPRMATAARRQLLADDLLRVAVVRPVLALGRTAAAVDDAAVDRAVHALAGAALVTSARSGAADDRAVDGAVRAIAAATLATSAGTRLVEERGVDAAVDVTAGLVARSGAAPSRLQTGRLFEYLRDTVGGIALVALILVLTTLL